MRLVVFAYHEVGYRCLQHLLDVGEEIAAVVTHEDRPDEEVWWRSVSSLARAHQLECATPADVNAAEFVARVRDWRADLALSFYYRQLLAPALLALFPRGAFNLHGSLLPKYRGRVPVNWVLVHGETETGVTLHEMVAEADAGAIVAQRRIPIAFTDTARTLFDRICTEAELLLAETWPQLKAGTAPRIPQDLSQGSCFGGRRPADGRIDWHWPALRIYNLVRAVTHPYPGAFTFVTGRMLYLWQCWPLAANAAAAPGTVVEVCDDGPLIATVDRLLLIRRGQFEGESELDGSELARHPALAPGAVLG